MNNAAIQIGDNIVYSGHNLDVLKTLADNSIDSIVTDPPYELGFMGKGWDKSGIAYSVELWQDCLRVLKPGGHLLAFGGSRTWHRLAVAIEDAGFEMRDSIAWLYGSGFPKSHNISKAIDKLQGYEGDVIGIKQIDIGMQGGSMHAGRERKIAEREIKELSPQAKAWAGWGTALKPAFEPIVVARKPLIGTVAENVLQFGVGGLNIDASRIDYQNEADQASATPQGQPRNHEYFGKQGQEAPRNDNSKGRWPANVILDETTAELLDEQSDASRFFYVAKASKRDRNEGLDELPEQIVTGRDAGQDARQVPYKTRSNPVKNIHPTVKPTQLMKYLIKLVTPEGGVVLDPFAGSGSTGKASLLEGYTFIGIELTAEYLPIIEGRLQHAYETYCNKADDLFA